MAELVGHELDVVRGRASRELEDLREAVPVAAAAQGVHPGDPRRGVAARLLARQQHRERAGNGGEVRGPVARELAQLGARRPAGVQARRRPGGAPGLRPGVRRRGQPQDRVALQEADEEVALVDHVHPRDERGDVAGRVRRRVRELQREQLVVGVHGHGGRVEARERRRRSPSRRRGQREDVLGVGGASPAGESTVRRPAIPGGGDEPCLAGRSDSVLSRAPRRGGSHLEHALGRDPEPTEEARVRVEGEERPPRRVAHGGAPEEHQARAGYLPLSLRTDGHDPGAGGVDVVPRDLDRPSLAGRQGPVCEAHGLLERRLAEASGEGRVHGERLACVRSGDFEREGGKRAGQGRRLRRSRPFRRAHERQSARASSQDSHHGPPLHPGARLAPPGAPGARRCDGPHTAGALTK